MASFPTVKKYCLDLLIPISHERLYFLILCGGIIKKCKHIDLVPIYKMHQLLGICGLIYEEEIVARSLCQIKSFLSPTLMVFLISSTTWLWTEGSHRT